jgi:NRPS condensation-like uncharacterized protein
MLGGEKLMCRDWPEQACVAEMFAAAVVRIPDISLEKLKFAVSQVIAQHTSLHCYFEKNQHGDWERKMRDPAQVAEEAFEFLVVENMQELIEKTRGRSHLLFPDVGSKERYKFFFARVKETGQMMSVLIANHTLADGFSFRPLYEGLYLAYYGRKMPQTYSIEKFAAGLERFLSCFNLLFNNSFFYFF